MQVPSIKIYTLNVDDEIELQVMSHSSSIAIKYGEEMARDNYGFTPKRISIVKSEPLEI